MTRKARQSRLFSDWRDFTREYVIVVLGVLTALLAQSAVEEWSWSRKVRAAVQDMDQELRTGNGPQSYVRLSIHQCLSNRLSKLRSLVERGDRVAVNDAIDGIQLPLRNYNSQAREAANSADITAHMPADRKYDYRIVYALTPELDSIHRKELDDLASLRALSLTGGPLLPDEKQALLEAIENLSLDNDRVRRAARFTLRRMHDLGIGLDKPQLERNFADLPTYRGCQARDIRPLLEMVPVISDGARR